jgi:hypothetical protein
MHKVLSLDGEHCGKLAHTSEPPDLGGLSRKRQEFVNGIPSVRLAHAPLTLDSGCI